MDLKVSSNFKNERNRLNLGQKEVADFLGMSSKQIGRWESSVAIPADKLAQLAELGFDVTYVVTGKRSQINEAILQSCINALENALDATNTQIPPDIKAKVIGVLYEESTESKQDVNEQNIKRILKLVA